MTSITGFTATGPFNWSFTACPQCGALVIVTLNGFSVVSGVPGFGELPGQRQVQVHDSYHRKLSALEERIRELEKSLAARQA